MIFENIPRFFARMTDVVFPGRNRARIVIGTDRKDTATSGYGVGGEDDPESATIDLVAGFGTDSNDINLPNDKSRIYISGKTDPDNYFDINEGDAVEGEATIVAISDNIYLKSRKKFKIIGPEYSIVVDENGNLTIKAGNNEIVMDDSGITIKPGSNTINLGSDNPTDNLALASKINTVLNAFANAQPSTSVPGDSGLAIHTAFKAAWTAIQQDVGSDKVKSD